MTLSFFCSVAFSGYVCVFVWFWYCVWCYLRWFYIVFVFAIASVALMFVVCLFYLLVWLFLDCLRLFMIWYVAYRLYRLAVLWLLLMVRWLRCFCLMLLFVNSVVLSVDNDCTPLFVICLIARGRWRLCYSCVVCVCCWCGWVVCLLFVVGLFNLVLITCIWLCVVVIVYWLFTCLLFRMRYYVC